MIRCGVGLRSWCHDGYIEQARVIDLNLEIEWIGRRKVKLSTGILCTDTQLDGTLGQEGPIRALGRDCPCANIVAYDETEEGEG